MPPVGAYVRAFSVMAERTTMSDHSPGYLEPDDQSRQNAVVRLRAAVASGTCGHGRCDGEPVSTNGTRSPAATSKCAVWWKSRPSTGTGVAKRTAYGPATNVVVPSMARTHGRMLP